MKVYLILLVLGVLGVVRVNSCRFGVGAIQTVYNRFEVFRERTAFDTKLPNYQLEQFQFHLADGNKQLSMKINGNYLVEYYKLVNDTIFTVLGQYDVQDGPTIYFKRNDAGNITFHDWSNGLVFNSSLTKLDDKLPADFRREYRQTLSDLNVMRKKMFKYRDNLMKDFEHLILFDFRPFPQGGFYSQFVDSDDGGLLSVGLDKSFGLQSIFGKYSCENRDEAYTVKNGWVYTRGYTV